MSFFQPAVWITPQGIEWVWMGAMGSIGLIGHYFIIKALEHAPASRLARWDILKSLAGAGWFDCLR